MGSASIKTTSLRQGFLTNMSNEVLDYIHQLFVKYKAASRGSLVWCIVLITWTVMMFWWNLEKIGEWQAKVIIAIIGILATVLAFYQHQHSKANK